MAPVVSYWHRFARSQWEIDLLLPTRVATRRPLPFAPKGWLSVGTELTGLHFFTSANLTALAPTSAFNYSCLQTGLLLEHPVAPHLWLGMRAGLEALG